MLPPYNVEWKSGERFTKYNIEMEVREGILALTIGDVKIVTLVGQCPNNFVKKKPEPFAKMQLQGLWLGTSVNAKYYPYIVSRLLL